MQTSARKNRQNLAALRRNLTAMIMLSAGITIYAGEITFEGNTRAALQETPDRSTGLDKIYVLYDTSGVDMIYETSTPSLVKIFRYSNLGGAFAEEVNGTQILADGVKINNVQGDCGYIVEEGDRRYYYWVVDYSSHSLVLNSITRSDSSDCDADIFDIDGNAGAIHYFTINGQQKQLSRDINVVYDTQEWSDLDKEFKTVATTKVYESLSAQLRIAPPAYCSTSFRISGDKFMEQWGVITEVESIVYNPIAVNVKTEAIQDDSTLSGSPSDSPLDDDSEDADSEDTPGSNQIKGDDDGLGGSAPAQIQFNAYVTQAVVHHEWQMSSDPEFNEVDYRFNEQNLDYTFTEEGTFYLRYIGSNADGSCEAVSDTYTVSIGASELLCPNAFSPDGDGVNDEWKVSYRSIIEFECWIFDRYGAQLCHFSDPQQGWDGKRGGKIVKPGVYYYVIQALGADGRKYKLSGDINIIRHRLSSGGNVTTE